MDIKVNLIRTVVWGTNYQMNELESTGPGNLFPQHTLNGVTMKTLSARLPSALRVRGSESPYVIESTTGRLRLQYYIIYASVYTYTQSEYGTVWYLVWCIR